MAENLLRVKILADVKDFQNNLKSAQSRIDQFSEKLKNVGSKLTTRLTLPIIGAGGAAIKMASDFNESLNKVDVAFGKSSGTVKNFAKTTLQTFGIAEGSALDMAALFGDMATSMGLSTDQAAKMSTQLVGLAGDLASFKNINIGQATTALAAVFTGETESLKRLGVVMTEANLQQFALNQGIKTQIKDMTQAEKVVLRYQFVMKATSNAHGDFSRTSDGAANQMRIFQESLKQLGASFGQVILPLFTDLVKYANDIIKSFGNLDPTTKKVVLAFAGLAAIAGPLLYLAGTVIPALVTAFAGLTLVSGGTVLAIGALVAALGATIKYQALKSTVNDLNTELTSLQNILGTVKDEQDGTVESSLKLYQAEKKLAEKKLEIAKANRDLKQGAIAELFGIENDEVKALNSEIEKHEKTISNYDTAIKGLENSLSNISKTTGGVKKSLEQLRKEELEKLQIKWALDEEAKAFNKEWNETIGAEIGGLSMSVNEAFQDPISEIFDPNSVLVLSSTFDDVAESFDAFIENYNEKTAKATELTNYWAGTIGGILMDSFMALAEGQDFFKTLIDGLKKLIIKLAAAAAAALILNMLLPGIGTGGAAKGGVAGFKTLFSGLAGIPEFANGGIVSGPTLGLMGEYAGAKSNPEVIAPLDKLKAMMGGGSQNVTVGGEFRIQGQDLVVALQRAERNRSRII